ncbi:MAG: stalk domain-containing protein [Bacillota bacterium]
MRKLKSLALASTLVLTFASGVLADSIYKEVVATERPDIRVKLDGMEQKLVNGSGYPVYALLYNDTTYLPVRAVATVTGKDVAWDQENQTVILTTKKTPYTVGQTQMIELALQHLANIKDKLGYYSYIMSSEVSKEAIQPHLDQLVADMGETENMHKVYTDYFEYNLSAPQREFVRFMRDAAAELGSIQTTTQGYLEALRSGDKEAAEQHKRDYYEKLWRLEDLVNQLERAAKQ